jgi:hypothetical protein
MQTLIEMKKKKKSECTIITYDYENDETVDGIQIRFVSF